MLLAVVTVARLYKWRRSAVSKKPYTLFPIEQGCVLHGEIAVNEAECLHSSSSQFRGLWVAEP